MIRVEVLDDASALGRRAAVIVAVELIAGRLRVFGVATGSSPSPVYAALADAALPGWDRVEVFALDEYVGLPAGSPQSYRCTVDNEVRIPLGIPRDRVHVPDGTATDPAAACSTYEAALAACGGVDVQLLGIGANGHLAFNEPGSNTASRTRVVRLSERTRRDNARFFHRLQDVPHLAMTQGLGTIAEARRHVLLAQGERKAFAVRAALEGPISPSCPASVLQRLDDVTVLLDPAAASQLSERSLQAADTAGWRGR